MHNKDTGGPAFPRPAVGQDCGKPYGEQSGMALRDWFAGQALVGMCANPMWDGIDWHDIASAAYDVANAMIAERQK